MHKKLLFLTLLFFLFSCTSERSFQAGPGKQPDVLKSRPIENIEQTDIHVAKIVVDDPAAVPDIKKAKNTPPLIKSVRFVPDVFHLGDVLGVEATGSDKDGDKVTFVYQWSVNGEPGGNTAKLDVQVQRGDDVSIKITPFDGKNYGHPLALEREIVNLPPMIVEDLNWDINGRTYLYQVKAEDPDGDALVYSLKASPEGMTITGSSGFVVWDVPSGFEGPAKVSVVVDDGYGGTSQYNMTITIQAEKESS